MAPTPRWHVSVGTQLTWHDGKFNQKYFGITPAEAAQATASGNLLTKTACGAHVDLTDQRCARRPVRHCTLIASFAIVATMHRAADSNAAFSLAFRARPQTLEEGD